MGPGNVTQFRRVALFSILGEDRGLIIVYHKLHIGMNQWALTRGQGKQPFLETGVG